MRPSHAGLLIVTSRDRHREVWGPAAVRFDLGPLDNDAGAQMLCEAAPQAGTLPEARGLATRLGGLPLALRAAGALLTEPTSRHSRFTDYLQALTDRTATVLPERPNGADPHVARALVGYTWGLSLDQLADDGVDLARALLRLLSLLADAPIPRSLLSTEWLTEITGQPTALAAIDAAVAGLHRYGLIEVPELALTLGLPAIAMHPMVREANAELLARHGDSIAWRQATDNALVRIVENVSTSGSAGWDTAQLLAPHLPMLSGLEQDGPSFIGACNALNKLANLLYQAGRSHSVLELHDAVLAAVVPILGPEHPYTMSSYHNLAEAMNDVGRYQEAADLHQHPLTTRERILGYDHLDTLDSRSRVASALHQLGRYQEAADLHEHILAARERTLGSDHPATLASRSCLGYAISELHQFQKAADLHRQTLTAFERTLGSSHEATIASRGHLASALRGLTRFQESAALHAQTLVAREGDLGSAHPLTLASRNNYANALRSLGRFQEAANLHLKNVIEWERVVGPDHPNTLISRNNLANALLHLGHFHKAAGLYRQVLTNRERVLGPSHPDTLASRMGVAAATRLCLYQEVGFAILLLWTTVHLGILVTGLWLLQGT